MSNSANTKKLIKEVILEVLKEEKELLKEYDPNTDKFQMKVFLLNRKK